MAERDPNTEARDVETELRFRASRTNAIGQADPPLTSYTLLTMADTLGASLDVSEAALERVERALEQQRGALRRLRRNLEEHDDWPAHSIVAFALADIDAILASSPGAAAETEPEEQHECMRCGSTDWTDIDYSGCSNCRAAETETSG